MKYVALDLESGVVMASEGVMLVWEVDFQALSFKKRHSAHSPTGREGITFVQRWSQQLSSGMGLLSCRTGLVMLLKSDSQYSSAISPQDVFTHIV